MESLTDATVTFVTAFDPRCLGEPPIRTQSMCMCMCMRMCVMHVCGDVAVRLPFLPRMGSAHAGSPPSPPISTISTTSTVFTHPHPASTHCLLADYAGGS